jgi:hypothetical protein
MNFSHIHRSILSWRPSPSLTFSNRMLRAGALLLTIVGDPSTPLIKGTRSSCGVSAKSMSSGEKPGFHLY